MVSCVIYKIQNFLLVIFNSKAVFRIFYKNNWICCFIKHCIIFQARNLSEVIHIVVRN